MAADRHIVENEMVAILPRLRRYGRSLTGSEHLADDLVQDACERAITRAHQFQEGTHLDRWMFSIMSSMWKNNLRANKVRQGAGVADEEEFAQLEDTRETNRAEDSVTMKAVERAMNALPNEQREVLALIAVEGFSYREAADMLEVPTGTVMSRLARARIALAKSVNWSASYA